MHDPYELYIERLRKYERHPIPRIIHQVWISKDGSGIIPEKEMRLSYNIEVGLPDALTTYEFWRNVDIDKLWELDELKQYKECYDKAQPHIIKCDMARYAILYAHGGIYMDMDCILNDKSLIADYERDMIYYYEDNKKDKVFNGYLVSRQYNPFWLLVLDIICNKLREHNYVVHSIPEVYATSGPQLLGKITGKVYDICSHRLSLPCYMPLPHTELPVNIDQPSMSEWKAELIKHEVQSTGNQWYYILIALLPILFILIFIMWCWSRNAIRRETIARLNREYKETEYTFS